MKNIHVLATPKPSRLVLERVNNNLFLTTTKDFGTEIMQFQNIYITNNEEIKERDWYLDLDLGKVCKNINPNEVSFNTKKKIILTDNKDLIADEIQAIDDEFLEWWIKNPSCEEVLVTNLYGDFNPIKYEYQIIIPKKEPKQEILEEAAENYATDMSGTYYEELDNSFREGAKWQQDKLCSSEVLQKIRATKSDAEARRIIRTI